jgi:hypothetical protein
MITSQNNGHGSMVTRETKEVMEAVVGTIRCNASYRIGDLIKRLFNIGRDGEDITYIT